MSKQHAASSSASKSSTEVDVGLSADVVELRREVANLRDHVVVLNEILDGIREDLQWVTQNGIPLREPIDFVRQIPVLKAMALDPAGDDWGDKLDINHGLKSSRPDAAPLTTAEADSAPDLTAELVTTGDELPPAAESTSPAATRLQSASTTAEKISPRRPRGSLF